MNSSKNLHEIKILLVEDEVITAMYLEKMLLKERFNVLKPVGTGEKAIKVAKNSCPDIILMDVRLAGKMDGLETAKEILNFCTCYIIFMTGYQLDSVDLKGEFKKNKFLMKPVDISKVVGEIKKHTQNHQ